MHRRTALIATALLTVLAGGCSDPVLVAGDFVAGPPRSGPSAPAVHPRWESCEVAVPTEPRDPDPEQPDVAFTLPLLGDGFQPVAVIVCAEGPRVLPGGDVEVVAREIRIEEADALIATLRLPDQMPAPGSSNFCTMDLPMVPWLALVDAGGRWIRPGIPFDGCGKPRMELRDAYYALVATAESSSAAPSPTGD